MARCAVIVFPGTWSDADCHHVLDEVFRVPVDYVWHKESDLSSYDIAILPGGFAHGDYLRPGAIARFSPVMDGIHRMAEEGKTVIGICNGFQVLCEAGLLPWSASPQRPPAVPVRMDESPRGEHSDALHEHGG